MKGSTFKRCTVCNRVVKYRKCASCGSTSWSWGYIVDVGKDGDGKRRQQRRTGFESEAEAKVALQELMTALAAGSYLEPTTMTLTEYCATSGWRRSSRRSCGAPRGSATDGSSRPASRLASGASGSRRSTRPT